MKQPYLVCGTIVNTHGVRGAVKIESHCDSPKVLAELPRLFLQTKEGIYEERKVVKASVGGSRVLAYLEGVETLDDAIPLKGKTVYAKREVVYASKDKGRDHLVERIESRNGGYTIECAEKLKIGTTNYKLLEI